jgi:GxxExxY protein
MGIIKERKFDPLSSNVINAALCVHKDLGPGFIESIYEEALKVELQKRNICFEAQRRIDVFYANKLVGYHILDLLVEGKLVVELKAASEINELFSAQVKSYLKATKSDIGLLLNFGTSMLGIKRVVLNYKDIE